MMIRRAADLSKFLAWMLEHEGKAFEEMIISLGFDAELNSALCRGDINTGPHPTIKDGNGRPAPCFFLTAKGRRRATRINKNY
jgi:hypothetical protein